MLSPLRVPRTAALLFGLAALIPGTVAAQQPVGPRVRDSLAAPAEKPAKGWRLRTELGLAEAYDNNVFLLDTGGKSKLAAPSPGQVTSGRYANMESASDLITTLSAVLDVQGPGLSGRTFTITPAVAYEFYLQNPKRSHALIGLSLEQSMAKKGRLRLQGALRPNYFAKNYLADAVDADANGSISSNERVYAAGVYSESELTLDYRFRLAASTNKHPFGATLMAGVGYGNRTYEPPFAGKDLKGPMAAVNFRMSLSPKVSLGLDYAYAAFSGTPTDQIQLLDEPSFGQDFNGNGNTTDQNVAVVSLVDPSRTENAIGGGVNFALGLHSALELAYEYRLRNYSSTDPLDVAHTNRQDARNQLGAQFKFGLGKALGMNIGGTYTSQTTNRPNDPGATGDTNDYTRFVAALGLTYIF